ncbi:restriction endonuclease subunit S [Vibrio alginolyticus]|uniref:restriction endonuclease subunit S n=2 Tax=Vibrio parahaemolyticus TaxID=670 RepID=UPI00111D0DE7|nr:restriction endonuclease subunit S [Vibrio parahaemolyticus]EGQ9178925.1 restriction endonuclease subunit S [Vibrio alginolyticus]EIC9816637.1 restriction endonuclease subunit S [Vibrio alginolyticus]EII5414837.1 restriction endonuclease subunit S [Vibrio alginolyticus]MDG3409472.1 restriction endonuclease subunit S [Vibrio parahaemolyticus]TOH79154.1 restriction endonuclease [Vibrio parahaemolyticus]
MSFETATLDSLCELVVDCPHSTPKWTDEGIIVLRNQNIKNGVLDLSAPSFTNEEDYLKRIKRAAPKAGDIVFTREAPMGEVCMIPEGLKCCLGQRQVLLRPKSDVNGQYLFWALQSPYVQQQIAWNEGTGSTVSNVRIPVLKALNIPRISNEDMVAKSLSDIASKMALNTQNNQTLEQMAQAIFKSWFVDFDPVKAKMNGDLPEGMDAATASLFPEKLVESDLGLIPDGWNINYIKDFGKVVTGKTPPKKVEDAYAEEGVPFVTPSDIDSDVFVSETKRFLSESGVEAVKKSLLPEGSICVTCIGSQMGKAVISPSEAISNQQINSVVVSKDYVRNFLFLNLRRRREEIFLIGSSGSTMPIINKSTFEKLAVLTPSEELMRSFDRSVSSLLSKIHQNAVENKTLSSLRDTLLPKLLSGEIELGAE